MGPGRIPRVARDVLAAQGGIGVFVGDDVAQLLEAVVAKTRNVDASRMHVRVSDRCRGVAGHTARITGL